MREGSFLFGDWQVEPGSSTLTRGDIHAQIEPRAMDVLVALCQEAGEVVSAETLLRRCWGNAVVGENQLHKAITQLRTVLGDRASAPQYIETIRKRGYRTVAAVRFPSGQMTQVAASSWQAGSPFCGLAAFDAAHADVFFGRDQAIQSVCASLEATSAAGYAQVVLLGASGSGKSSLIQAGVLPALTRPQAFCRVLQSVSLALGDLGGLPLPVALGSTLLDLEIDGKPVFDGYTADLLSRDLADAPATVLPHIRRALSGDARNRFALFIDQLEALFAHDAIPAEDEARFLACIDALAASGHVLVIHACRNDFYPELTARAQLMRGKSQGGHVDLLPPTHADVALMIRQPARAAGLHFGMDDASHARLDDLLCNDAASGGDTLPLLQYVLHELYLRRSPDHALTVAAYLELGGMEGALGHRAEAVLQALPEVAQSALPRVLSLLVALKHPDAPASSHRVRWDTLISEAERQLVQALVEARLLVSTGDRETAVFGVVHEALLRKWPRVVDWITQHRQALALRTRLHEHARHWEAAGRPSDQLIQRSQALREAQTLLAEDHLPIGDATRALIQASLKRKQRLQRVRTTFMSGFFMLGSVAIILGWQAHRAEGQALERRREAEELMGYMLGDLVDQLRPLGRLDLLKGVGDKALNQLSLQSPESLNSASRNHRARALLTIAEVARSQGQTEAAARALAQAQSLLNYSLQQDGEQAALLKDLGAIAFWQGQAEADKGRDANAHQHYQRYLQFAQRMQRLDPESPDAWIETSYAHGALATTALNLRKFDEASSRIQEAIRLKLMAIARRPNDRVLRADYANDLSWRGSLSEQTGHLQNALDDFEQEARQLSELLQSQSSDTDYVWRLASSQIRQAKLLYAMGNLASAQQITLAANRHAHDLLAQDPANTLWFSLAQFSQSLSAILQASENPAAARTQLESVIRSIERNPAAQSDIDLFWLRIDNYLEMAHISYLHLGTIDNRSLIAARQLLASKVSAAHPRQQALAQARLLLADTVRSDARTRESACSKAIQLMEPFHRQYIGHVMTAIWVEAHACAGRLQAVRTDIQRLDAMGYRQTDFQALLSHQHGKQL
ncbi:winged helix-turn-helix domain-containing protein [Burkholderiaceae bacterium DAT-1]|nr:winged helix-turn-helix domain-containing protein [Burkholderiaceae bacterium DAT-1]